MQIMVKVIGTTWTFRELKEKLDINNLDDFIDLEDKIEEDKEKYLYKWKEIVEEWLNDIELEIQELWKELWKHVNEKKKIELTLFIKIKFFLIQYWIKRKIRKKNKKINYIKENFDKYSYEIVKNDINNLEYKKSRLSELKEVYYWAIWEERVVNYFRKKINYWVLINDFNKHFDEPIFTKWWRDIIMSIQIDHIFINDKGIFLIETKNRWKDSVDNMNFSPIKQAKLHSHAFYFYLRDLCYFYNNNDIPKIYNIVLSTWRWNIKSYDKYVNVLRVNDLEWFINSRRWYLKNDILTRIVNKLKEENEVY
jgi:hypothetical protein